MDRLENQDSEESSRAQLEDLLNQALGKADELELTMVAIRISEALDNVAAAYR